MDPNFHKYLELSGLTLHFIVNWQILREWNGGEGSLCMPEHVCVFEIIFVFHAVACVCVVLLMVLLETPTTLFNILLLFNYVCYELCVQHYRR